VSLSRALVCILSLLLGAVASCRGKSPPARLRLATTTSLDNSGLLSVLLPAFEKEYGCKVDVLSVGTGKALKLAESGDVDVVFTHSPKMEMDYIRKGAVSNRQSVMVSDFVIAGPQDDPAGVRASSSVEEAFRKIASHRATFVSRGDLSGTHLKEREIWERARLSPQGPWYNEAGQGMGQTLTIADEKNGYLLTDRATFLAFKGKLRLKMLFSGDPLLANLYSVMAAGSSEHPALHLEKAMLFIRWMTSEEAAEIIENFRIEGEAPFKPLGTGAKSEEYTGKRLLPEGSSRLTEKALK